jgi:hypothetical protein
MHPVLKPPDVLTDTLATHAGVHLYIEKVTNGQHTLSVCEASSLVGERINALMPIWSKLLTTSTPGEVSKVRLSSSMLRAPRREVVAAAIGGGDESRRERGGGGGPRFFFLTWLAFSAIFISAWTWGGSPVRKRERACM